MNLHQPPFGDAGPSSYPHPDPSAQRHSAMAASAYDAPSISSFIVSPEMNPHNMSRLSPTIHHPAPQHPMDGHPQAHVMMQYQHMTPAHHPQPQPVPTFSGVNYMPMQRHPSVSTTRSESPHPMMGADVFGGPVNAPMLESGMMVDHPHSQSHLSVGYEYGSVAESYGSEIPLGISPARALGPAPRVPQPFQTPGSSDSHVTPQHKNNPAPYRQFLSSSSTESSSDNSSSVERPARNAPKMSDNSDDENESPTKRVRDRIPTFEPPECRANPPPKRANALASRPKAGPAGAGRSSAKLTKVAEDPGVEGIPPGPRSTERPSQSFACIIGQAILKSSAGGLSLEHIYRYVETAYPYFKTVDQWRNSVRHNLSIHKIFVTAPRTEKHPPGKGGIWIIDEAEKIHWPSEDKFIKNFQPSHPHHAVCRQTLHERAQEKKLREKAEAEGRPYIPKKGKRSKLHKQDELKKSEPLVFPPPSQQQMGAPPLPPNMHHHQHPMPPQVPMPMSLPPVPQPPPIRGPHPHMHAVPQPMSPPSYSGSQGRFDFEDDSDFIPDDTKPHIPPLRFPPSNKDKRMVLAPPPPMAPPRGFPGQENKPIIHDEDGVFSTVGPTPKHTRPADGDPLSPVQEQADVNSFLEADMFITPSRGRPSQPFTPVSESSRQLTSSALKTPALIQTSSSPTSSPMPPTVTRSTHHHPSGLQQAWTQDDMVRSTGPSSPARLEAAFDLKPTPKRDRDDDFNSLAPRAVERPGPPKTPVTRSSAAAGMDRDRTPRVGNTRTPILKTPLRYGGSPARLHAPSTVMSTPMWEMNGILDRLDGSPTRTPRSDVPPTSPTHYSLSDAGDSPIAKRRKVAAS